MDNKHHRKVKSERFKKFKGNKSEGQGFADKRKRKAKYEYIKMLKKEKNKIREHDEAAGSSKQNREKNSGPRTSQAHLNRYHKQKKEFDNKKIEKEKRKHDAIRKRKEREAAMEHYTKKKKANYKKLCKKTQRGQPLMRERIELLLSKIENKYNQT